MLNIEFVTTKARELSNSRERSEVRCGVWSVFVIDAVQVEDVKDVLSDYKNQSFRILKQNKQDEVKWSPNIAQKSLYFCKKKPLLFEIVPVSALESLKKLLHLIEKKA